MIRVTVELWPFGDEQNKRELAAVEIGNDGTGTNTRGSYNVRAMRGPTFDKAQRHGRVENHPRQSQHVLTLLRKSLQAMGY